MVLFAAGISSRIATTLAFLVAISASAVAQGLTFTPGPPALTQMQPNSAYGTVRFKLQLFENGRPSSRSVYDALLNGLQSFPFMNQSGQYILTLELLSSNDEVLARRALVQATRQTSGWLIFNRVEKTSESNELAGDIKISSLIRPDTNNLRVRMKALYTKEAKFDLTTLNLLLKILEQTKALGAANTAIEAVWKPVATQVEALINSYQSQEVSETATLSFAHFNEDPNAANGVFTRQYQYSDNNDTTRRVKVQVSVSTVTTAARIVLMNNGKVNPIPSYGDVLAAAVVGDQPIELVLSSSKTDAVKKFFTDLNSTNGYTGDDIGEKCDTTYDELAKYYSVTDKAATYWALLNAHRRKLAANKNAKDCLNTTLRQQITSLGLSLDELPFSKSTVQESVAVAATTTVPAAKVVADQKLLEKVVKEKDTNKTFQSFPLRQIVQ